MPFRLLSFAALTIVLGLSIVNAQHDQRTHAGQVTTHQRISLEHLCVQTPADNVQKSAEHTAHLASILGLTAEQSVAVERATSEFCVAMKKFHDQVSEVLTPEQRAKLQALHGGDHRN